MRYLFVVVLSIFSWTISVAQISVFPHNENFETFTACFESCTSPCVLSSNWTNVTTDGTDWITDANGTPSPGTGPTANGGADHNPGVAGGKYLYLESTPCQSITGILESPYLDFTGGTSPYVTFWYHMYGGSMGTLHVDVSTDSGASWTNNVIPSITSNTNVWQQSTVGLGAFGGQIVKVRFRGNIGAGSSSDMAIDDVTFHLVEQMNVGVTNIQSNDSLFCDYATNELCIEIINADSVQLDSAILNVRINGTLFNSPFPFTTSLAAGATTTICLGQAPISAGDIVSAVISMPNGVTDSISANDSIAETIVLQALPIIDLNQDTLICPNDTITIGGSPTGPIGATYSWSNSGGYLSSNSISNPLASANTTEMYYVTVTDTFGCASADSFQISNHTIPIVDAGADIALCPLVTYVFGGAPTSATGVNFEWYGPNGNLLAAVANPSLVVNNIGQYVVVVEDANTCVNTDTMEITAPANVLPNAGIDTTVCEGDSIQIGELASSAYNYYDWTPGIFLSDSTISNPMVLVSAPIQYVLEVQDTFGCVLYDTLNLGIYTLPLVDAGANTTICLLDSVTLGGSPTSATAITYSWSPGLLMVDSTVANPFAAVPADTTYFLTVTDANGCFNYDSVTVATDSLPEISAGQDLSICFGDVTLIGGFPAGAAGSVFNWSPGAFLSDSTIANPSYTVTSNQTFILEVTDANGCHGFDTVNVSINTSSVLPQTPDTTVCLGDTFLFSSTPSAAFTTFSWSSAAYMTNVNSNPVETFVTGTTEYTLAATDTFGCGYVDTIMVFSYAPVLIDAGPDVSICLNDSVTLGGSPTGNPGSSYTWSGAGLLDSSNVANPMTVSLFDTIFILQVIDSNTCIAYDTISFNSLELPVLDAGIDQSACIGETVVIGGAPSGDVSSSFSWSLGQSLNDSTIANPSYMVADTSSFVLMVTDTNSCVAYDTAVVNAFPLSVLNLQNDTTICQNIVLPLGNTQPASFTTFNWTPGTLTTDSTVAQTSANMNNTTQYVLEATDIYGCVYYDSVLVNIQPAPFADAGLDNEICFGETYVLGGSPTGPNGASFSWSSNFTGFVNGDTNENPSVIFSTAGTFEFIVEVSDSLGCPTLDTVNVIVKNQVAADAGADQAICTGDSATLGGAPTGLTSSVFSWTSFAFLSSDTAQNPVTTVSDTAEYQLMVQDTFGCFGYDTVYVYTHTLPNLNVGIDTVICEGESITLGGAPTSQISATINWSPGNTLNDSTSISNPVATPVISTIYTAILIDPFGCTFTDSISIGVYSMPMANAGPDLNICSGQSVQLLATTGVNAVWSPDSSLSNAFVLNPVASPDVNTNYILTSTTGGGACTVTDTMTVSLIALPVISLADTLEYCNFSLGEIAATTSESLNYSWTVNSPNISLDNPTDSALTFTASDSAYIYLEVTNTSNGCVSYDSVYLEWHPKPVGSAMPTPTISCIGDSVQLEAFGGDIYQWSPSLQLSNPNISNPILVVYADTTLNIILTTNEGCSDTVDVSVAAADLVVANAGPDSEICQLDTIQLSASGGLTYQWNVDATLSSNNIANPRAFPVLTKVYSVTASDQYGCFGVDQVTITVNPLPNASAGIPRRVCLNEQVQIGGNPSGPANSTYVWSPAASVDDFSSSNPFVSPSVNTTYYVTVTSNKGCQDSSSVIVTVDSLPTLNLITEPLSVCRGDSTLIEVTAGINKYSWAPGARMLDSTKASVTVYPTQNTTYIVTATDGRGCVSSLSVDVEIYQLPVLNQPNPKEMCFGDSVDIEISSATGVSYLWEPSISVGDSTAAKTYAKPVETSVYQVYVTDENGCVNAASQFITVNPLPYADAGDDISNCDMNAVYLGGDKTALPGSTISWQPAEFVDNPYALNPLALTAERTLFYLTVQDDQGCETVDSILVNADCYAIIYAPTAFTPGSNNINDEFLITHYRVIDPKLTIYNRWGEIVFETEDLDKGWDGISQKTGSEAIAGVFYWSLVYKSDDNKKLSKDGTVTLIR
ncbi:MAG: gliding motility-associated C-terminal domain-containing protein [Salibacteraceae bacterium]|nr:gliding motility-associated C-terminal domain-containing protein [Salibacteraceae bacterium]